MKAMKNYFVHHMLPVHVPISVEIIAKVQSLNLIGL